MPMFDATAVSYAKGAERLLGEDASYLRDNPDMVPQFVNSLFQSLEISMKEFGVKSGLVTDVEIKGGPRGKIGNGHDIKKLGGLLRERLGNILSRPLVNILTHGIDDDVSVIIEKMIFSEEFEATRSSYTKRKLVYHAELEPGDMQIVPFLKPWLTSVKSVSENINNAVALVKKWKTTGSEQSFRDWYVHEISFIYR